MTATMVERKVEGANRSRLARELGVDRSHVSQVLGGKCEPGLNVAAGIAKGLGVSLDELYGYLEQQRERELVAV